MVQRIFGQSGKVGSRRSFEVVFCCLQDQTKSKNEDNKTKQPRLQRTEAELQYITVNAGNLKAVDLPFQFKILLNRNSDFDAGTGSRPGCPDLTLMSF